jgi:hypothetical protein
MAFLQAELAGGPVPATQVSRMATHEHGLTAKAVRMGRESLAVEIAREGFRPGSRSLWSLAGGPQSHGARTRRNHALACKNARGRVSSSSKTAAVRACP